MTYFVIEESSWQHEAVDRVSYVERIEQWLDSLDRAWERQEGACASHVLLTVEVFNQTLADVFWSGGLPWEVQERITTHFNRMNYWDDEGEYQKWDARVGGLSLEFAPSLAYTHRRVSDGDLVACLPLPGRWRGRIEVGDASDLALVHFVVDDATHRDFFRHGIELQKLDLASIENLVPHAYPSTRFLDHTWRDARDFEGGYARVRESLLAFLAMFDDHAGWIHRDESGRIHPSESADDVKRVPVTRHLIEQRFRGFGYEVAPESPEVASDSKCRRARERDVGGRIIYCEWHYKIQRHTNRVHFHGPIPESDDLPIIAIFCQHLPLP